MSDLNFHDISDETYREYEFVYDLTGSTRVYRINNPKGLYTRNGGSTHRIVDADGVAHCVPAPGWSGCVLRWHSPKGVSF